MEGVFPLAGNPLHAPVRWTFTRGHTRYWTHVYDHPPVDSDEWIEYIQPDGVIERDGDLWWRVYSPVDDTTHYTQLTKRGP